MLRSARATHFVAMACCLAAASGGRAQNNDVQAGLPVHVWVAGTTGQTQSYVTTGFWSTSNPNNLPVAAAAINAWGQLVDYYLVQETQINITAALGISGSGFLPSLPNDPVQVQSGSFQLGTSTISSHSPVTLDCGLLRVVAGQAYTLNLSYTNVASGSVNVQPPPGYRVVINGLCANSASLAPQVTFQVLPTFSGIPGAAGYASGIAGAAINWQLSLGSLIYGDPAGTLEISDPGNEPNPGNGTSPWATLFTPAGLSYESASSSVYVYRQAGVIRQVFAPQMVVDVESIATPNAYNEPYFELRCYSSTQMVYTGSYPFSFTGQPYATYRILQGATPTTLTIIRETRNIPDALATNVPITRSDTLTLQRSGSWPNFSWTRSDWTQTSQLALATTSVAGGGTAANRNESVQLVGSDGAIATKLSRNFSVLNCGEMMTSETIGQSNPATTGFDYYASTTSPGSFGFVQDIEAPGGGWVAYDYYDTSVQDSYQTGRVKYKYQPYGNAPSAPTHDPAKGLVTYYEYSPDVFGFFTRPSVIETFVNGTMTSKSVTTYTNGVYASSVVSSVTNAYSDASHYVQSAEKFYSEDNDASFAGKPYSITSPSGAKTCYIYQGGVWDGTSATFTWDGSGSACSRTVVITGTANNAPDATNCTLAFGAAIDAIYLIPGKSTAAVVVRDSRALPVRTEQYVWFNGGWAMVSYTNNVFNVAGQETSSVCSSGASTSSTYDGLLKTSDTQANGVTTSYTYDAMGRLQISTRGGAGQISPLATHFAYDAAGRLTEERVGWGQTEQLVTDTSYDDAGRIIAQTPPGIGTTTFAYDIAARTKTTIRPDGGTIVDAANLDGTAASETGTSVIAKYMAYGTTATGQSTLTAYSGSASSPRYKETWADWLGRTVQTQSPGFTGQPAMVQTNEYDQTTGLLTRSTRTGYAATAYSYDPFGNPYQTGLDVDGNGGLVVASDDRISQTNTYFEQYQNAWWQRTDTVSYLTAGNATPTTVSTTRTRLSGFPVGVEAETMSIDIEGNVTDQQTAINTATATTTTTTTSTGLADPAIAIAVDGLLTSSTTHDQLTTTTAYDGLARTSVITNSRGNPTTTTYVSGTTLPYTVTDGTETVVQTLGYDNLGRKTSSEDAGGHYTRLAYDFLDRVTNQWGDGALPASYTFDPTYGDKLTMSTYRGGGGWSGTTWPTGAGTADTTTWTYDPPTGLQTAKTDAENHAVTQTYNLRGQTATRSLARGVVTTYAYDPNTGELLSQSYSDGTPSVGYTYNRQGKRATITDATGTRTLGYDSNHPWRFSTETLSAYFGSDVLTRLYASSGVLGRVNGFQLGSAGGSNSVLEQDYGFTSDGRFSTITSSSNGNEYSRTFQYFYLPNSALVQGLAALGDNPFSISRTFETQRDYLTSVQTNWSSTVEVDYAYITNALGQREFRTESGQAFADYGNSLTRSYTYDGRGELITAPEYLGTSAGTNPMPGRQDSYNYDNFGNRTSVSRLSGGAVAETYAPNSLNQYSVKENNDVSVAGTADPNANIAVQGTTAVSAARQGRFWEAEVGVANSTSPWAGYLPIYVGKAGAGPEGTDLAQINTKWTQLGEVNQSFTYDNDGNLTNDGVWTYTWDAENRLIQMQPTSLAVSSGVPNYLLVFMYDYMGRRVQKRVTNLANGGSEVSSRRFVYDGWNLVAEYTAPGGATFGVAVRTYTWGLDIARSMKDAGGVGALVQIADQASAKTYLPGYDGNGNIAVLINGDTGVLAADYQYDPFGQLLRSDELDQAIYGQPFRFSTKFEDIETSLIYYGHRYSSPSMGRFINRDPIEESGGLNLYVFCGNDGINRWDVLGNIPIIGDEGRFESSSLGGAGGGAAIIGAKGGAAFFNYAINEGNEATGDSELNMGGSDASSLASQQNEVANDQEATATQEAVSQAQSAAIVANLNASLNPGTDAAGAQADAEAGAQLSAWANQSVDTSSASVSAVAASEPSDPPSPPDPAGLNTAPGTQVPQGNVAVGQLTVINDNITNSTPDLSGVPAMADNDASGTATVSALNSANAPPQQLSEAEMQTGNSLTVINANLYALQNPTFNQQLNAAGSVSFAGFDSPLVQYGAPGAALGIGLLPLASGAVAASGVVGAASSAYYGIAAGVISNAGLSAFGAGIIVASGAVPDGASEQFDAFVSSTFGETVAFQMQMVDLSSESAHYLYDAYSDAHP